MNYSLFLEKLRHKNIITLLEREYKSMINLNYNN